MSISCYTEGIEWDAYEGAENPPHEYQTDEYKDIVFLASVMMLLVSRGDALQK